MRKRWLGAVVLLLSTLVTFGPSPAQAAGPQPADRSAGRYIVVLDAGEDPDRVSEEHARSEGARVELVYRHALQGYAATMSAGAAARISRDPRVASVEADQVAHAFDHGELVSGVDRIAAPGDKHVVPSHLTINGKDDVRIDVDVAVIDTGIDHTHPELHVVAGTDCTGGGPFNKTCVDGFAGDGNGHGTHVAGTVAAIDNGTGVVGVAPGARLHAVRVLDNSGSGYLSWIVAGIDWVTARGGKNGPISVANMSLGCECTSAAMDTAIATSVAAGIVYAVAAGNSDKDASTFSPANHPDVITVSALADFDGVSGGAGAKTCRTDLDDTLADFSNWGAKVEITAPGVCIRSTWPGGGYNTISGTSMASPHAAGAAALLTSQSKPADKAGADKVRQTLVSEGNTGWTDDSGDGITEPLLDVSKSTVFTPNTVTTGSEPTNAAPSASFTYGCTDLTCSFTDTSTDGDGSIASRAWAFGDGTGSTATNPSHTYAAGGTYAVTLTVTDDDGATGSASKSVTVSSGATTKISLSASGYKVKGTQHADLTWSGTDPNVANVDVFRDGALLTTTANDGSHTDNIGKKGGGSYTYKVCEAGTSTCSNEATVTF